MQGPADETTTTQNIVVHCDCLKLYMDNVKVVLQLHQRQ